MVAVAADTNQLVAVAARIPLVLPLNLAAELPESVGHRTHLVGIVFVGIDEGRLDDLLFVVVPIGRNDRPLRVVVVRLGVAVEADVLDERQRFRKAGDDLGIFQAGQQTLVRVGVGDGVRNFAESGAHREDLVLQFFVASFYKLEVAPFFSSVTHSFFD